MLEPRDTSFKEMEFIARYLVMTDDGKLFFYEFKFNLKLLRLLRVLVKYFRVLIKYFRMLVKYFRVLVKYFRVLIKRIAYITQSFAENAKLRTNILKHNGILVTLRRTIRALAIRLFFIFRTALFCHI